MRHPRVLSGLCGNQDGSVADNGISTHVVNSEYLATIKGTHHVESGQREHMKIHGVRPGSQ